MTDPAEPSLRIRPDLRSGAYFVTTDNSTLVLAEWSIVQALVEFMDRKLGDPVFMSVGSPYNDPRLS